MANIEHCLEVEFDLHSNHILYIETVVCMQESRHTVDSEILWCGVFMVAIALQKLNT